MLLRMRPEINGSEERPFGRVSKDPHESRPGARLLTMTTLDAL
jgi:hypothetical protein